jgi:hypothetical protein
MQRLNKHMEQTVATLHCVAQALSHPYDLFRAVLMPRVSFDSVKAEFGFLLP